MSRAVRVARAARPRAGSRPVPVAEPLRRECVLRGLEAMTEEDRLVLALQLCDGLPDEDTAAALGLTVRSVRRTRERMLLALRRALEGLPFRTRPATPSAARSAA